MKNIFGRRKLKWPLFAAGHNRMKARNKFVKTDLLTNETQKKTAPKLMTLAGIIMNFSLEKKTAKLIFEMVIEQHCVSLIRCWLVEFLQLFSFKNNKKKKQMLANNKLFSENEKL